MEKGILESDFPFEEKFDLMGIQRHLKCAGIFTRLNLRDGKPKYLSYIPRVLNYLRCSVEKYPEFSEFNQFLVEEVLPLSKTFDRSSRNHMKAMILAAGLGKRLRPLTLKIPKALIEINQKALILYHLEKLKSIGVEEVVINLHYHGDMIKSFLGDGLF